MGVLWKCKIFLPTWQYITFACISCFPQWKRFFSKQLYFSRSICSTLIVDVIGIFFCEFTCDVDSVVLLSILNMFLLPLLIEHSFHPLCCGHLIIMKWSLFLWRLMIVVLLQSLESEITRLSHLRDRASDMGHRKEYPLLARFYQQFYLFYTVQFFAVISILCLVSFFGHMMEIVSVL